MIRYSGQNYEDSEDYADDIIAAEQRKKDGIKCQNCKCWNSITDYCSALKYKVKATDWCHRFMRMP